MRNQYQLPPQFVLPLCREGAVDVVEVAFVYIKQRERTDTSVAVVDVRLLNLPVHASLG